VHKAVFTAQWGFRQIDKTRARVIQISNIILIDAAWGALSVVARGVV